MKTYNLITTPPQEGAKLYFKGTSAVANKSTVFEHIPTMLFKDQYGNDYSMPQFNLQNIYWEEKVLGKATKVINCKTTGYTVADLNGFGRKYVRCFPWRTTGGAHVYPIYDYEGFMDFCSKRDPYVADCKDKGHEVDKFIIRAWLKECQETKLKKNAKYLVNIVLDSCPFG